MHQGEETDKGLRLIYDALDLLDERRYKLRHRGLVNRPTLVRYYRIVLSNALPSDFTIENYKYWNDDMREPFPPIRFYIGYDHDVKIGDYTGRGFRVEINNVKHRKIKK